MDKFTLKLSEDKRYILISDLYIATYLICKGIESEALKPNENKKTQIYFLFRASDVSKISDCIKEFMSGKGTVKANQFSAELRKQKSLVKSLSDLPNPQDTVKERNLLLLNDSGVFEVQKEE